MIRRLYELVLQIHELYFISFRVSCIKLHELSANKRVAKTDKFQLCMHPVTASLLDSVGGAGSVGSWVHGSEIICGFMDNSGNETVSEMENYLICYFCYYSAEVFHLHFSIHALSNPFMPYMQRWFHLWLKLWESNTVYVQETIIYNCCMAPSVYIDIIPAQSRQRSEKSMAEQFFPFHT